jgi:hypothetical protein
MHTDEEHLFSPQTRLLKTSTQHPFPSYPMKPRRRRPSFLEASAAVSTGVAVEDLPEKSRSGARWMRTGLRHHFPPLPLPQARPLASGPSRASCASLPRTPLSPRSTTPTGARAGDCADPIRIRALPEVRLHRSGEHAFQMITMSHDVFNPTQLRTSPRAIKYLDHNTSAQRSSVP